MSLRAQAIAEGFKYIARRGSKIVAFASTKAEAAREGTPEKLPSVPAKYLRGFKGKARVQRVREILRERRRGTFEPLPSDKGVSTKRSKWSVQFEQTYGERPDDIADVARLTGVSRAVLKQVYDRGLAAWSTGGHRPGASQHGWAMARVQSFVLGGPTTRTADKDLVKNPAFVETYGDGASVELGSGALAADSDLLKEGFDLVSTAYAPIGGHLNINEPDDLLNEGTTFYFADIDKDPEADVLQVSKRKKAGLKMSAVGHDGQKASRRHLIQYKIDRLHEPGNYAEVSGRIAEILLGVGVPVVNDKATVERMLGKKVRWLGTNKDFPRTSGWYSRKIGKSNHKKVLVGTPLVANPRTLKDRIKEVQALNLGLVQVSVDPYKAYCVIDSTGEVVGALATMPPPPSEVFGEDGEIYTNRCWDAPMVFFSAVSRDYQGKGLGGLLYLWAMAAGDGLFPDRASVSEKASRVWERLREMDETVWFEFDDIEAPRTHRFEDDCLVYDDPDEEHLDGVYELKHSDAVKVLQAVKPLLKKGEQYRGDLSDKLLYQAASFLFESVY